MGPGVAVLVVLIGAIKERGEKVAQVRCNGTMGGWLFCGARLASFLCCHDDEDGPDIDGGCGGIRKEQRIWCLGCQYV
jgi:hypothetical protein